MLLTPSRLISTCLSKHACLTSAHGHPDDGHRPRTHLPAAPRRRRPPEFRRLRRSARHPRARAHAHPSRFRRDRPATGGRQRRCAREPVSRAVERIRPHRRLRRRQLPWRLDRRGDGDHRIAPGLGRGPGGCGGHRRGRSPRTGPHVAGAGRARPTGLVRPVEGARSGGAPPGRPGARCPGTWRRSPCTAGRCRTPRSSAGWRR